MGKRVKRFVVIPGVILLLVALGLFGLQQTGNLDLAIGGASENEGESASDSSESEDGESKKEGKDRRKKGDDEEEEIVPVPVELALAEPRQISAYYRASSFIEADRQVDLVTKTVGRVQSLNVEEGDWVDKGQVLAELENGRERIQLRQKELALGDQRRELTRRESLLEQKLITQEEFDTTRSAFETAEADRDLAKIALEETLIRAPFAGQITDRKIVPGQHINMSEALFTLVDFVPLRVRTHLPEVVARKVSQGDEVEIVLEALEEPVSATVERISPVVDPSTSTVKLTLLLDANARDVRVGGFVKIRITTDTHFEALAIPKLALVEEGGLRSVFLVEADSVRKVDIKTGLYDESHCEVLDGLEEGTFVVTLGQGGLRSGSKIDVLNSADVGWVAPEPEEDENDETQEAEVAINDDAGDEE